MKKVYITTTKPDCQTEVEIFRTPPVVQRRVSEVKVCKSNDEGKIAFKIFAKISWLTELAEATLEQSLIKKFK